MITSSRHDNERKAKRKKILGIILGGVFLVLIFHSPVEGVLSNIFQFISRPFFVIENNTREKISAYSYLLSSKNSLLEENKRLKDALDLVAIEAYSREALRKENDELKLMLGRHTGRTILLARVLANPGRAPYDTLIIDAGSADGLALNMRVFVGGDFVIGEVTRLFAHSAMVTLYSSDGNELPVTIQKTGTSSVPTIGYGIGGGNFRSILPKGLNIIPGDLVDVPAIATQYAGVVNGVKKSEGSSLQEIYFKLPLNIYTLRYVYIATNEEVPGKITQ